MSDLLQQLAAPFDPAIVSWRIGPTNREKTKGMALAYIDARDVMRRLDEVCGPENWQNDYPWSDGKRVICRIGIKIDGEWLWKTNGAGDTDTEGEKGALSDAFKRAAVHWGIGRYLYDSKSPWIPIEQQGKSYVIPDDELLKLANLLRRQFGASAERPADGLTPPATVTAPAPKKISAERKARVAKASANKERLMAAIQEADLPEVIDKLLKDARADLAEIKELYEPAYDAVMALAVGRKTELYGATG